MERWIWDLRVAMRGLRRRPGFATVVLLTLGLGIGATTTIFSVVDTVLLRPLPYDDAARLVAVGNTFPGREWSEQAPELQHLAGVSWANFAEVRDRVRSFQGLAAGEWGSVLLPDDGSGPQVVSQLRVTEGFFDLLGAAPILGRTFLTDDFGPAGSSLVVLSHYAWRTRFGADPGIVGRTIPTAFGSLTVIGVLEEGFRPPEALFPASTEFYAPVDGTHERYAARGRRSLAAVGRLADGATLEQLRSELTTVAASLAEAYPEGNVYPDGDHLGWGANILQDDTVGGTRRTLLIFLAASALILLVAVLNAAHLLLVRGMDRAAEISLQRAVGAGRWAITRHLLAESVLLALGGGALGALLATGGVAAFVRFVPGSMPRLAEVTVDVRVLAACALASLVVGVVTGLVPALRFGARDVSEALKLGAGRTVASGGGRSRLVLVSGQLALALILAVGATLLFESFLRVRSVDAGFDPSELVTFSMPLKTPTSGDGPAWVAWDDLLREVRAVPGIQATAGSNLPFQSPNWAPSILLPGEPLETRRSGIAGYVVTPGYRDVLGIPLLEGRDLAAADGADAEPVALVNAAFAREVLDGAPAVGRTIRFRGDDGEPEDVRVVGVVGDVVQTRAEEPKGPAVYVPYTQTEWSYSAHVAVRTDRSLASLSPELRQAVARFFPAYPIRDLNTMRARIGSTRTEPRFQALLLISFAAVALLLAAVGLYGSLAHMVGRRTREMGIRMVLGADPGDIVGLVLRHGGIAVGIGLAAGLAGALAVTRFLRGFLFEIGAFHVPAFLWAGLLLGGLAALAVVGPARRALRVDLVESLRSD